MGAFFAILIIGGLAWAFANSSAKEPKKLPGEPPTRLPPAQGPDPIGPTSPGQPTGNVPPPDLQKQIDRYLGEVSDPMTLEFAADMLEARGFPEAAELLRAKAKAIKLGIDPFSGTTSPGIPGL